MKLTEAKLKQLILEAIQEEEIQQLQTLLLNLAAFSNSCAYAADLRLRVSDKIMTTYPSEQRAEKHQLFVPLWQALESAGRRASKLSDWFRYGIVFVVGQEIKAKIHSAAADLRNQQQLQPGHMRLYTKPFSLYLRLTPNEKDSLAANLLDVVNSELPRAHAAVMQMASETMDDMATHLTDGPSGLTARRLKNVENAFWEFQVGINAVEALLADSTFTDAAADTLGELFG